MKSLVEYSGSDDSSDDDDKDNDAVPPKKMKLQLPMLLDQKGADNDRDETPEHHQMRTRSIPHVEGNWASHIRVDCERHLETLLRC